MLVEGVDRAAARVALAAAAAIAATAIWTDLQRPQVQQAGWDAAASSASQWCARRVDLLVTASDRSRPS